MAFTKHYRYELENLRSLSVEFSKKHPSLAPMLTGTSSDPDVERLLEGVAFLTSLLYQKLDDNFPEIIHTLSDIIFPHYLRTIPSTSVIKFFPKDSLKERFVLKKGISLASKKIDNERCLFRTCFETVTYPLVLERSYVKRASAKEISLIIDFRFLDFMPQGFLEDALRLYLGGSYSKSSDLFKTLMCDLDYFRIYDEELSLSFAPSCIKACGFYDENRLLEYPKRSFSGYGYLQEYFILPEKFTYVDIEGVKEFFSKAKGDRFSIEFCLKDGVSFIDELSEDSFQLFCSPIINLFSHEAEPITRDHKLSKYRIRPSIKESESIEIYSIDNVIGLTKSSFEKREYRSFEYASPSENHKSYKLYQLLKNISPISGKKELFISFIHEDNELFEDIETISIKATCTNGDLSEKLKTGDIAYETDTSPERLGFKNISNVTVPVEPPIDDNMIWNFLGHLSLNLFSISDVNSIKEVLRLYVFSTDRDKARVASNIMKIEAVENIDIKSEDRLVQGFLVRGQKISLKLRGDHFPSKGDMFIFGCVLDEFFSAHSSINTYTYLEIIDTITGEARRWEPRLGRKKLS